MLFKKISVVALLLVLVSLAAGSFINSARAGVALPIGAENKNDKRTVIERCERHLADNLPLAQPLRYFSTKAQYLLGTKEQNGVFITPERLIENIKPPNDELVTESIRAILSFTERRSTPTYVSIIPTASAVLQRETPRFAEVYDQKLFIENAYRSFAGKLSCIDVYSVLFQNSEKSLYYNTETLLAPQGGYLVYNVLEKRMGDTPYPLDRFEIEYLEEDYYGALTRRVDYADVAPDRLSIYKYAGEEREYALKVFSKQEREYNTLYPRHLYELRGPLSIYLGGTAPMITITQRQSSQGSVLVFGDRQMLSILPFMAANYRHITAIDLAQIPAKTLSELDFDKYDEILFVYSADTFMNSESIARIGLY